MDWILETFRNNPAIPIFLTLGLGFWLGQLKFKNFSLGVVTAVLLVGVAVGQMNIPIGAPIKSVFFLLFLFAIGYSVGPQFFRSLKGSGIKQVLFAVVICALCLVCTWGACKVMGYNVGETVGIFAGAQTISAVIGAGIDTVNTLPASAADKAGWVAIIPVAYAVTYVYGTIGSAWVLGNLGPKMLGGLAKVKADTQALELEMNQSTLTTDQAYIEANRPVAFRAYKLDTDFFDTPRTVVETEAYLQQNGRRLFVERVRTAADGKIVDPDATFQLKRGDQVALSGRREFIVGDEKWIGDEIFDQQLLDFPAEQMDILVTKKTIGGMTVDQVRRQKFMYGISIKTIKRSGVDIPVLAQTVIEPGDTITVIGMAKEVEAALPKLGYADRPTEKSDLILVGFGIFIGCIIGVLTIHAGGVPISLSTSGGALIMGLICGWLRSKHPTFGKIPQPAVWVLNNLGLNMFIAVVGITSGPTFFGALKELGLPLFVVGAVATTLPLIIAMWLGAKVFKFRPAINLGCCAGARTTTASLGAIQESLGSSVPAMSYTVTYAIGNTLLILMGIAIALIS